MELTENPPDFNIAFTQTIAKYAGPHGLGYRAKYKGTVVLLRKKLSEMGVYELYAELTLNGDIHYHGSLKVVDKVKYYKNMAWLKKNYGFNLFKYIDNYKVWKKYIEKDAPVMEMLLKDKFPLVNYLIAPEEVLGAEEQCDESAAKDPKSE